MIHKGFIMEIHLDDLKQMKCNDETNITSIELKGGVTILVDIKLNNIELVDGFMLILDKPKHNKNKQ